MRVFDDASLAETSLSGLGKLDTLTVFSFVSVFLWDHKVHCGILENGVLLMYTLEGVSSVTNFITAYEESQ